MSGAIIKKVHKPVSGGGHSGSGWTAAVPFSRFGGVGDGVTDNASALVAFGLFAIPLTAAQVVLNVANGTYEFNKTTSFSSLMGINQLIFNGPATFQNLESNAGPWIPDCFPNLNVGGGAVVELIDTVSAGSYSVTLKTPANAINFPIGAAVVVMSEDIQISSSNFSYPPNCNLFDYSKVVSVNSLTGVIVLNSSLNNSHSDSNIDGPSSTTNPCGKARIWLLDTPSTAPTEWFISHIYENITITSGPTPAFQYIAMNGNFIKWENCSITGISPSIAGTVYLINCTINGPQVNANEPDKIVNTLLIDGCHSLVPLVFQSSSINNVTIRNSTIDVFLGSGTTKNVVIDNCILAIYGEGIGGNPYGHNLSTTISNSVISDIVPFSFHNGFPWVLGGANLETIDGVNITYAAGVITVPNNTANLSHWNVVPNVTHLNLATTANNYFTGDIGTALVTSLTEDATNIYYHVSGWPVALPAYANGNVYISRHGPFYAYNLTGCDDAVQASTATAAGKFPWELFVHSYVDADGFVGNTTYLVGEFVSITVTIVNPTATPGVVWQLVTNLVDSTTMTGSQSLVINIDITLAGTRTFTQSALTGKQGNDDVILGGVSQATMPVNKWAQTSPTWAYDNGLPPTPRSLSVDVSALFNPGTQFRKAAP